MLILFYLNKRAYEKLLFVEKVKCKSFTLCTLCTCPHYAFDLWKKKIIGRVLVQLNNNFDRRMMKLKAY